MQLSVTFQVHLINSIQILESAIKSGLQQNLTLIKNVIGQSPGEAVMKIYDSNIGGSHVININDTNTFTGEDSFELVETVTLQELLDMIARDR